MLNMNDCERCGPRRGIRKPGGEIEIKGERADYCANCSKNLCAECMAKGCCGQVPAASGAEADGPNEEFDTLMMMVRSAGKKVDFNQVVAWTQEQRDAAWRWATSVVRATVPGINEPTVAMPAHVSVLADRRKP